LDGAHPRRSKLIIGSAFSTEATDVGWIIPLPAAPEAIQPVSPGALKTLSFCLQPDITHFMPGWFVALAIFAIASSFVCMWGLVFGFAPKGYDTGRQVHDGREPPVIWEIPVNTSLSTNGRRN